VTVKYRNYSTLVLEKRLLALRLAKAYTSPFCLTTRPSGLARRLKNSICEAWSCAKDHVTHRPRNPV